MKAYVNMKRKLASLCYILNAIVFFIIGLSFVFKREFFSFHSDVIQTQWSELNTSTQMLYLGMMRTEGAGYLAAAIALTILLLIPYRQGEKWSYWAMSAIGITEYLPTLWANIHVSMNSGASPPWIISFVGILLLLVALLTLVTKDTHD